MKPRLHFLDTPPLHKEQSAAEKAAHKASLKAAYDEDMAAAAAVTTSAKNVQAKLTRAEMQRRLDEEGEDHLSRSREGEWIVVGSNK